MEPDVIDAVDRTLAILGCFSSERPVLGISEISRELGLHKSAVFRSLVSLEARGFVSKDPRSRRYMVGPQILRPAGAYLQTIDLHQYSRPSMEDLRDRTRETVSLYVLAGDRCVCVDVLQSHLDVRRVVSIGNQVPLHAGSTGKVMLAYLTESVRNGYLDRLASYDFDGTSPPAREALLSQLELIRQEGVAISQEERVSEVASTSAPIFGAMGEIAACLTVSGPTDRLKESRLGQSAALVKEAAGEISRRLGYGLYRRPAEKRARSIDKPLAAS